jgi:hypothetical protein
MIRRERKRLSEGEEIKKVMTKEREKVKEREKERERERKRERERRRVRGIVGAYRRAYFPPTSLAL